MKIIAAIISFILLFSCVPPDVAKKTITPNDTVVGQRAVDGDTIELTDGRAVRIVGIDTPERGQCGYKEATAVMSNLVTGKTLKVLPAGKTNKDRYGRILRYIEVGRVDVGLRQINLGRAIARYDSRDGYGTHPREVRYVAADSRTKSRNICDTPKTQVFDNCTAARAAGAAPVRKGQPGYGEHLDRDLDGIGCD